MTTTSMERFYYWQDGRRRIGRSPALIRYFEEGSRVARTDQPWAYQDRVHVVGEGRTIRRWEATR